MFKASSSSPLVENNGKVVSRKRKTAEATLPDEAVHLHIASASTDSVRGEVSGQKHAYTKLVKIESWSRRSPSPPWAQEPNQRRTKCSNSSLEIGDAN